MPTHDELSEININKAFDGVMNRYPIIMISSIVMLGLYGCASDSRKAGMLEQGEQEFICGDFYLNNAIDFNNIDQAFEKFEASSKHKNPKGINALGICYRRGLGTVTYKSNSQFNDTKALELFRESAKMRDPQGMFNYALACINNFSEINVHDVRKYLEDSASANFSPAQRFIGFLYLTGEYGLYGVDYEKGVSWYEKAAVNGNLDAQLFLAKINKDGLFNCEIDYSKMLLFLNMAVRQNDTRAKYEMYLCYFNGIGVALDKTEAYSWCRKAAKLDEFSYLNSYNSLGAIATLVYLEAHGEGCAVNLKNAATNALISANFGISGMSDKYSEYVQSMTKEEVFFIEKESTDAVNKINTAHQVIDYIIYFPVDIWEDKI